MKGTGRVGNQGRAYSAGAALRDSVSLSAAARAARTAPAPAPNPEQRLKELLETVKKAYPSVNVLFGELSSEQEVRRFAAGEGKGGVTLILSKEYLSGVSDEEAMSVIGKALARLSQRVGGLCQGKVPLGMGVAVSGSGKLSFWAALRREDEDPAEKYIQRQLDALKEHMERILAKKQENKFKLKRKLDYNVMDDMSRLIKARTVRDARSMVSKLYGRQFLLKQGKQNYEDGEVETTLARIDAIILRAKVKVRKLNEEARLEKRRQRAAKRHQADRARGLREELRKKRTARRSLEYAQVFTASPYLAALPHKPESKWEETLFPQGEVALGAGAGAAGASGGTAAPAAVLAAASPVSVVVATGIDAVV